MKRIVSLLCLLLLVFGASCTRDSEPETRALMDGVWVGTGEGRGGTIIASVEVKGHVVSKVTIVSQSESSFAQETINTIIQKAVGRGDLLNPEVDAISGATLTSGGVIDAVNMALLASMGKSADGKKVYRNGSCDIAIVGAGGAGLSAAVAAAEAENHILITEAVRGNGANRLGGNGVADIVVNGKLAGEAAARY